MTTRLCLLPPAIALSLSPARIRMLRRRYEGLDGFDEAEPLAIVRALSFRELPERTADLFHGVAYLATEDGREAILEAARSRRDLTPWLRLSAADLAVEVVSRAEADDRIGTEICARARIRVGRLLAQRVEYELFLRRAERPKKLESIVDAGRAVHGSAFVDGWVVDCRDGVLRAVIVHEGLPVALVTRQGHAARRRLRRALACDAIRWDAARRRVGLTLARPSMLPSWIETLGITTAADRHLLDDRRPAFTLKGPHREGRAWFTRERLPRGAKLAEVVACEVDDGVRFGSRGEDALGAMHARAGLGGYMYRTTTRFTGARGHGDVTVELPNKLIVADLRFDALLREGLDAAELTQPGKIPDDLPSLAPWEQPEWRWVEVVTREAFDWAVREGVVVPSRSNRPADESFRAHGSMFTAHEIDGEPLVYCCPGDFSVHARDEAAGVLVRWKLDVAKLVAKMREALELSPPARGRIGEVPDGAVVLSELETKGGSVVFFLVLGAVRKEDVAAFGEKLRTACSKAQHAVAIVASGRALEGAVSVVEVEPAQHLGFGEMADIVARGADAVKLGEHIEPWRWGTRAKPAVLVRETREIYLGKVRLDLTENQRTLISVLAEERGEYVSPPNLGRKISANATIPDQVVRKAMGDLVERVRASAEAAGVVLPEEWILGLVEEKRGKGYRLGVGVVVR